MSVTALIWWATLAGVVIVLAMAVRELMRALREIKRLQHRINAYAESPLAAALRSAQGDAVRLETALTRVEPLLVRALAALATIRRGPVPGDVQAAFRSLRVGAAVIRTIARR